MIEYHLPANRSDLTKNVIYIYFRYKIIRVNCFFVKVQGNIFYFKDMVVISIVFNYKIVEMYQCNTR